MNILKTAFIFAAAGAMTTHEIVDQNLHSIPLSTKKGQDKMAHYIDRTVNLRSSQEPASLWTDVIETLYGVQDTRSEFDL